MNARWRIAFQTLIGRPLMTVRTWVSSRPWALFLSGAALMCAFLWRRESLPVAINGLVAAGTLGMAYFSFELNRQSRATERRRIKPLCYCEPTEEREQFERYGVAPKAFFFQKKDDKEIDGGEIKGAPLIFEASITNGGTGPACNVRMCLASTHLFSEDGRPYFWTELVPVAPVIIPSIYPWRFSYSFTDAKIPPSRKERRAGGESSPTNGSITDLIHNVTAVYLQYEDLEGNVCHSLLPLLMRAGSLDDSDDTKRKGLEPLTQFGDGELPMHAWYRNSQPWPTSITESPQPGIAGIGGDTKLPS